MTYYLESSATPCIFLIIMEVVTSTIPGNPPLIRDPILDAQLKRLREEKQNLLASGIYYEDDEIIMDLDKEIQRLQVAITNSA
ncbi:unnamed protein product [Rodentolepis nana]|uniref:Na+/H+ antiporter n=1 Tax=Rodentolepis nana TaxID=102285 RepID=A0A0R3T9J6_RODNA|nr:unnamed protein product [Rodentolepis nana]